MTESEYIAAVKRCPVVTLSVTAWVIPSYKRSERLERFFVVRRGRMSAVLVACDVVEFPRENPSLIYGLARNSRPGRLAGLQVARDSELQAVNNQLA